MEARDLGLHRHEEDGPIQEARTTLKMSVGRIADALHKTRAKLAALAGLP
jgi:hypothetical protein